MQQEVAASQPAIQLADEMVERHDVMQQIVWETLNSAMTGQIKEAGRTKCPANGSIEGPLQRFPRAIDLASCPTERGGAWHTHVTPEEIRNPENSLPDISNVLFGLLDVSVVAGSETADVVVSPEDDQVARDIFRNAIGADVSSPQEVTEAAMSGRINPPRARERVRDALPELFRTAPTGYTQFEDAIQSLHAEQWAHPAGSGKLEAFTGNTMTFNPVVATDSFDDAGEAADQLLNRWQLKSLVISTAIGTIVGTYVERLVFGD